LGDVGGGSWWGGERGGRNTRSGDATRPVSGDRGGAG